MSAEGRRGRSRLRTALLCVIGLLYALSIPWYRESGAASGTWFGFPDWVAVSIGCYFAIAILNAIAWLLTDVPDAAGSDSEGEARIRRLRKHAAELRSTAHTPRARIRQHRKHAAELRSTAHIPSESGR